MTSISWMVLAFVLAFQLWVFGRSRSLASRDDDQALTDLIGRFEPDLIARAKRGDSPDWLRYFDEADRIYERRSDEVRVLATSALVVGIGGTMVALAFHLGFTDADEQSLASLIAAMSLALFASLSGVVNNLLITLWLLRGADDRFAASLADFRRRLHDASAAHPPHETFADAVKSQLGDAFREAVEKFPEAFEKLDDNVQSLAAVIERQSAAVLSAAAQLREGAEGLSTAAAGIGPAVTGLAASTDQLRAMPDQLKSTLDTTRNAWEQEVRRDRAAFIGGVRQVLSEQQALLESTKAAFDEWESRRRADAEAAEKRRRADAETAEARRREFEAAVNSLPGVFAAEIDQLSGALGREFGVQARNHVQDLVQKIAEGNEKLRAQVDRATTELQTVFLNSTSHVVASTVEKVYQRAESTLLASLDEVGRGLKEAVTKLPNDAESFAQSLTDADGKMQQALDRLKSSSDQLARVAEFTDDLEGALIRALSKATAEQIRETHAQINEMVESLIQFIRELVDRLARQGSAP